MSVGSRHPPAEEAKGKLDTDRAIIGWFDRYPARYYEMRLERVIKELAADATEGTNGAMIATTRKIRAWRSAELI